MEDFDIAVDSDAELEGFEDEGSEERELSQHWETVTREATGLDQKQE